MYDRGVGRWKPDAPGRLEKAALELYDEQGYEATTVAQIAARAGVTERTFYRHFTDKREVLFKTNPLAGVFREAVASAEDASRPFDLVVHALTEGAPFLQERGELARRRHAVISATPELQEREQAKLSALARELADALIERGVAPDTAAVAGGMGIAVFRVAYERWVADPGRRTLVAHVHACADLARALTAPDSSTGADAVARTPA